MIDRAFALAEELHRGQTRPGTDVPYLAHLLGVCALVLEQGGGEVEASAALLHDAVEDQGGPPTLERIRGEFGDDVARIVDGLTDGPQEDWRERKRAYLERLEHEPADVLRVSLADKLDNARTLARDRRAYGEAVWERVGKDRGDQRWYFGALIDVFRRRAPGNLTEELAREVKSLTG
ncbi:MAG TPA: HD domain-containing protein [Solirubrobacteraceae bacterium]